MILCAGEALIDMLPVAQANGPDAFAPHSGGAVFNTAIALGRLGISTGFLSGLSTDLFGQQLATDLAASGVSTDLCIQSPRPTTLAFVRLTDGHASYTFYDENSAGRMLEPALMPSLPGAVEAVFLGGISLAVEPSGTAYEAFLHNVSDRVVTMVDPNVRKDFITDEAAYRARVGRMIAAADIVKLSDEDLLWLEGDGAVEVLAKGLLERGPKLVVLTRGAQGATAFSAVGDVSVAAQPVTVVDTVGAGDTFNAGILAGLADRGCLTKPALAALSADDMSGALALAARAAAVTVSRAGANPPRRDELPTG